MPSQKPRDHLAEAAIHQNGRYYLLSVFTCRIIDLLKFSIFCGLLYVADNPLLKAILGMNWNF